MTEKYTAEQLEAIEKKEVIKLFLANQEQMEMMLDAMNQLTEQLRIANQYRFGRHTEKLEAISGQLNLFDEADALYDEDVPEPDIEEIIPPTPRKKRPKGKRDLDLDGLDQEEILHSVSKETLDSFYGSGNWKKCWMIYIVSSVMNRHPGLSRFIWLRSMSEQMETIRMNS